MKVLLVGGSGYIGTFISGILKKKSVDFFVLDLKRPLDLDYNYIIGDATQEKVLLKAIKDNNITHLVYLSAFTDINCSMGKDEKYIENNVGPIRILKRNNIKLESLILASTGAVYKNTDGPQKENQPVCDQSSAYAKSKILMEQEAFRINATKNVKSLRFSNVYGGNQWTLKGTRNLVPRLFRCALTGESFNLHGDGSQSRDFIHIKDLSEKVVELTLEKGSGKEIVNVSTGETTKVIDVIKYIEKTTSRKIKVTKTEENPGKDSSILNNSKVLSKGNHEYKSIKEGLKSQWESILEARRQACVVMYVGIDGLEREENLKIVLKNIRDRYPYDIIIGSMRSEDKKLEKIVSETGDDTIKIVYNKDIPPDKYSRSHALNAAIKETDSDIIIMHDADLIFTTYSILDCVNKMLTNKFCMAFPFKTGYNVKRNFIKKLTGPHGVDIISARKDRGGRMGPNFGFKSKGCCPIFLREIYTKMGGSNEDIMGWGASDVDLYERALYVSGGKPAYRRNVFMYHMWHPKKGGWYTQQSTKKVREIMSKAKKDRK